MKRILAIVVLILGESSILLPTGAMAQSKGNPNPGVIPPQAHYYGKTYGDYAGEWWNWALQFPTDQCPVLDETGEDALLGQSGHVYFLAGTFGGTATRYVTIPTGKALFFPLLNTLWSVPFDGDTEEEVRAIANTQADPSRIASMTCSLDGREFTDLLAYRGESPPGGFVWIIPEGSITDTDFDYDPGYQDPAVADGYWILLAPLSRGQHVLHFSVETIDGFALDVTYYLTVMPAKK